jgi:hypothetical protein
MKSAKRKPPRKTPKKRTSAQSKSTKKKAARIPPKRESEITDQMARKAGLSAMPARPLPGTGSGDLQGLSDSERANSQSVDELVEDGNAFEAGVVEGVEEAENSESEVRTREVPEDDVPQEYLDEE